MPLVEVAYIQWPDSSNQSSCCTHGLFLLWAISFMDFQMMVSYAGLMKVTIILLSQNFPLHRQLLHAVEIRFPHPVTRKETLIRSDNEKILKELKQSS